MLNLSFCVLSVCIHPEFLKTQISLFVLTKYVHGSTFEVSFHISMLPSGAVLYSKLDPSDRDIVIPYYILRTSLSQSL